ncbi:MAG: TetR/AcrR family transcriptional regulator [Frankiales bacterium]|nr:TetR/AcrR family transcriptional regulator [Frankiales bacterium]
MSTVIRTRRADAVRNAQKVLEAAREVFAERGLEAGVDQVAARAGVGKATVYRCYATKEDLITAVVGARVDWFTALARDAVASADPWAAYVSLLDQGAESGCSSALLHAGLAAAPSSAELEHKRALCRSALQDLLDVLKARGRVRADITAREVTVLLCGAFRTLREEGVQDLAEWRRYADLVAAATRV